MKQFEFTTEYLRKIAFSENSYTRGLSYFKKGNVNYISTISTRNGTSISVEGEVEGTDSVYDADFTVNSEGKIIRFGCDCPAASCYDGACKHVIALALKYSEQNSSYSISTDREALSLMRSAAAKTMGQLSSGSEKVSLEPCLSIGYRSVSAEFKVGTKRMYVIKNLREFAELFLTGEVKDYGKELSLRHDISCFDEKSLPILRFLLPRVSTGRFYSYSSSKYRELQLSGFDLDALFDIYKDNSIIVDGCHTNIIRENPHFSVKVAPAEGGCEISLTEKEDTYCFLGKGEYSYYLIGSELYISDREFADNAAELLKSLINNDTVRVAEKDMPAFWRSVMEPAAKTVKVISEADTAKYASVKLKTFLYLDMPSENTVSARLEFVYGDVKKGGFQSKTAESSPDIAGELAAERMVMKYFSSVNPKASKAFICNNEDELYTLLTEGIPELSRLMTVFASESIDNIKVRPQVSAKVGVRLSSGLLELELISDEYSREELADMLKDYRKGKKYRRLSSGSFISLGSPEMAALAELTEDLRLDSKELLKEKIALPGYRMLYLDKLMKERTELRFEKNREFSRKAREFSSAEFTVPADLEDILRDYQTEGFRWLKAISEYGFGGILADDMGLGKTIQTIALLMSDKQDRIDKGLPPMPSLIVCPSSLCLNWQSEIEKFGSGLVCTAADGNADNRSRILAEYQNSDIIVTSYDLLKRDIQLYDELHFRFVIIDEAQYIKNHSTQSAKSVKSVDGQVRLALTGTPVENSLAELWSVFDFIMPGYLFNYTDFKRRYEQPIVKENSDKALDSLRRMTAPFILRRLKRDVLSELPEKNEVVLTAAMEGEQRKLYDAEVSRLKAMLTDSRSDSGQGKMEILAELTRLRQICCDPSLAYENYKGGSAKLTLCTDLTESCVSSGHKVLLFSQFTSMLSIIEEQLAKLGIKTVSLTGSTPPSKRLEMVERFNTDDTEVFLISLKAGGTGLNLTGADIVIHYDPWWNASAENQATDRAYRIGQKNNVTVYKLIAKGTIEEKIKELQSAKTELADSLVTAGGGVSLLDRNELLALFG